jgi:protein TonB
MKKFLEFVGRNYIYPASASRMGVSGRVIIQFVIEKDGKLSDMKILRDIGYGTGEEALRVLSRSPKWNPGIQHGIPVRVSYTLPIALNAPR